MVTGREKPISDLASARLTTRCALEALRKNHDLEEGKRFLRLDRELDGAGFGPIWLKKPQVADIVLDAIDRVVLAGLCVAHAYVVMPNHVHMLIQPNVDLKQITRAIKGSSARACNEVLHRTGLPF